MPQADPASETERPSRAGHRLRLGKYRVPLPRSRTARIALGIALLIGGAMFFLPLLGLWMLPLGLLVLSAEFAAVRRFRRRVAVWWGRRRGAQTKKGPDGGSGPKALGNGGVSSREDAGRLPP